MLNFLIVFFFIIALFIWTLLTLIPIWWWGERIMIALDGNYKGRGRNIKEGIKLSIYCVLSISLILAIPFAFIPGKLW